MQFSRSSIPCRNSANDQAVATYTYDSFGRRLWKTVAPNQPGNDSASPKTTYLYYTDEGYAAEYTHVGNHPNSEASITPVLSQLYLFAPEGLWSTEPLAIKQTGDTPGWRYPETDHLGTPHGLISKAGTETTDLRANAFGQTEVTGEPLPLRFAGQTEDDETGGYYNFHRDYEPGLGRYRESDPIGLEGGINTFAYVDSTPQISIDPTGEFRTPRTPNTGTGVRQPLSPIPMPAPVVPFMPLPPSPMPGLSSPPGIGDAAPGIPNPNQPVGETDSCKANCSFLRDAGLYQRCIELGSIYPHPNRNAALNYARNYYGQVAVRGDRGPKSSGLCWQRNFEHYGLNISGTNKYPASLLSCSCCVDIPGGGYKITTRYRIQHDKW